MTDTEEKILKGLPDGVVALTPEEAKNALAFLSRVQMPGSEARVFVNLIQKLEQIAGGG